MSNTINPVYGFFIPAIHEGGVSLRTDIAEWQFTVVAEGVMKFSNENTGKSSHSYFYRNRAVQISKIFDISSAVLLSEFMHKNNAWDIRTPYELSEPLEFTCTSLTIIDRYKKLVMKADIFDGELLWLPVIVGKSEQANAFSEAGWLHNESITEMLGGNHDYARGLRRKAVNIMSRIATTRYCRTRIIEELEATSNMTPDDLDLKLRLAIARCDLDDRSRLPF